MIRVKPLRAFAYVFSGLDRGGGVVVDGVVTRKGTTVRTEKLEEEDDEEEEEEESEEVGGIGMIEEDTEEEEEAEEEEVAGIEGGGKGIISIGYWLRESFIQYFFVCMYWKHE